ncbi:MAG: DNA polymerase III subunit delta [Marinicaulis sp.]|nr:DNA polymerase III subunit delta [Marinicaulis sp.]
MTAIKGRAIKDFVARREEKFSAVLVYGPDAGLVRERAVRLAGFVVDDLKDPFNALELTDADIKAEPARIIDEAAALSFTGGERVIRVRTSGEASSKSITAFLTALDAGDVKTNGMVIIEAGELSPRSGIRKAFEKAKRAAALPCYADTPQDVRALAQEMGRAEDLQFDRDALDLLATILGDDHALTRSELEKLILYKGPKPLRKMASSVTVDDIRACLVPGVGDAIDDTAAAAMDGAPKRLADALFKAGAAGASPIAVLRALLRQLTRLKAAREHMDSGDSAAAAMKKLRPPVFFAEQRAFENRLYKWNTGRIDSAIRMLTDTELAAKTTGAPQRELVERAALRLAVMPGR